MRQQKLADGRIEGEAVDAVSSRVDEHRRRAVDDVACRHLVAPRLQRVLHRDAPEVIIRNLIDGENGADGHVHVHVARSVERIEQDHVLALAAVEEQRDGFGVLFGADEAHLAAASERPHELLVGEHVELFLDLALHVHVPGVAEKVVDETSLAHVAVDDLGGHGEVAEEARELSLRAG